MIMKKVMIIVLIFSVRCLNSSGIHLLPQDYQDYNDTFLVSNGASIIRASSAHLGTVLNRHNINVVPQTATQTTETIVTGITNKWGLNTSKGSNGYYYDDINEFKNGVAAFQSDGSFVVGGMNFLNQDGYAYLKKFSATGQAEWVWNDPALNVINGIVSDGAHGYYVAGYYIIPAANAGGWVFHIKSDGTKDALFNSGNQVDFANQSDYKSYFSTLSGVGRQSTGKIVVGGPVYSDTRNVDVKRLGSDGAIDTIFSSINNTYNFTNPLGLDATPSLALGVDSQDRILVTGTDGSSSHVWRLNADGGFDNSFGTSGVCNLPVSTVPKSILLLSDDSMIIVGSDGQGSSKMRVVKITANGSLDTTFGAGKGFVDIGYLIVTQTPTPQGSNIAYSAAVLPNGNIAVVGRVDSSGGSSADSYFGIVLLKSDGTLDTNFTIPEGTAGAIAGTVIVQPSFQVSATNGKESAAFGVGYQNVAGSTGLVVTGWTGSSVQGAIHGKGIGLVFYSDNK